MEDNETLKSVRDQFYEVQHLNLDLCKSLDEVMDENVILQNDLDETLDNNDELETEVEDLQARIKDLETINSGLNDLVNNQEDDLLELENKYSELLNEIEANSKDAVCEDLGPAARKRTEKRTSGEPSSTPRNGAGNRAKCEDVNF